MRANTRKCDVRGFFVHTHRMLQQIAISSKRSCYNKFRNNYELHQFKGTGSGRFSPDSRWRPFIIVTAVRKSDRSDIGAFLPDLFIGSRRFQAFAFCVFLYLVVHLSATTKVRSDAAPWVVSSRQCRVGPDLERSTPTSSDVAENTYRASAGSLGEDTRRSVTRQGAQFRGRWRHWDQKIVPRTGGEGGGEERRPAQPGKPLWPTTLRAHRITTVSSTHHHCVLQPSNARGRNSVAKTGRGQNKKTIGQKPAVSTTGHPRQSGEGRERGGAERGAAQRGERGKSEGVAEGEKVEGSRAGVGDGEARFETDGEAGRAQGYGCLAGNGRDGEVRQEKVGK